MSISKIYLDMDGVIADFTQRYYEMFHLLPREAEKHKRFDELFRQFIATRQFASLNTMPGAYDGIRYLANCGVPVEILSSTARDEFYDTIAQQKTEWLKNRGINFETNFVPGKRHKYKFATPDSIIIDDTKSVIDDWEKAGGIAIHHFNWQDTLSKLDEILTTPK